MSSPESPGGRTAVLLAALGVGAGAALLALPRVLYGWTLTPDSVGYVAVAHNWISGAGFVDPILYSYYLSDAAPPVAAMHIRPPLLSLLIALPLSLGASLTTLHWLHVAWASAIGGAAVLVARRTLSLPAAIAFGLALAWSHPWVVVSQRLLTEATAIGILLLFLSQLRRGLASYPGALWLAALTLLGWATRPNLAIVAPAFLAAALFELGPRRALRSGPLWCYALGSIALWRACVLVYEAIHGLPPYAHYGVMAELLHIGDLASYQREWIGAIPFLREHWSEVVDGVLANARSFVWMLFVRAEYLHVGWLALPAVPWALWAGGPAALERRFAAIAGLGFALVAIASFGSFDPARYPLPAAVCFAFVGLSLVDATAAWLDRPSPSSAGGGAVESRALRFVPLIVVLLVIPSIDFAGWMTASRGQVAAFLQSGTLRIGGILSAPRDGQPRWDRTAREFCPYIERGAVVASPNPWTVYLWCGNPGRLVPPDLSTPEWVDRYLDRERPGYVVLTDQPPFDEARRSPRLEPLAHHGGKRLYQVRDAAPAAWPAPPPLARIGERKPGPRHR